MDLHWDMDGVHFFQYTCGALPIPEICLSRINGLAAAHARAVLSGPLHARDSNNQVPVNLEPASRDVGSEGGSLRLAPTIWQTDASTHVLDRNIEAWFDGARVWSRTGLPCARALSFMQTDGAA